MVQEENCVEKTIKFTTLAGLSGAFYSISLGWWFALSRKSTIKDLAHRTPLYALIGTTYAATFCSLKQVRGEDIWNAGIAGALAGAVAGYRGDFPKSFQGNFLIISLATNMPSFFSHVVVFGIVGAFTEFGVKDISSKSGLSMEERREVRGGFFKYQRDPFEARWKAIQEKEKH
ncbi:hypothetical protein HK096_010945 [Nowakowskiella sp. JEL0078]|nr:hypothetical protein HK096_010945 [Nowakowskiella sp. JEL0078]